jgi:flagellar basal body-associated protein FliL
MNKKSKRIIAIAAIIVILAGLLDFGFYSSTISYSSIHYSQQDNDKINTDKFLNWNLKGNIKYLNYNTNIEDSMSDSVSQNSVSRVQIQVKYIEDLSVGLARFLPIYKPFSFKSIIHYKWTASIDKNNKLYSIRNQDAINIEGDASILGLCSAKNAKKMVAKGVQEKVIQEIKDDIKNYIIRIK